MVNLLRVRVLPLLWAISVLAGAPCALADDHDMADEGDDPPLVSPEARRDLGLEDDDEPGARRPSSAAAAGPRNTIYLAKVVARAGDTVRAIAYRYYSSPSLLALVNHIAFGRGANPQLREGQSLRVPIARGSPSGFDKGEQLLPGPGMQMGKTFERKWGRPHMVRLLRQVFAEVARKWPQRHPAHIGSLSQQGGGRLGRHKSHRSGQDIDVGYYTKAARRADWGKPSLDEIDYERTWYLIDRLEQTGHVAAIFIAPDIQRRLYSYAASKGVPDARLRMLLQHGPKGGRGETLIRHSPGHRDHMHIRLWVPQDMDDVRGELGV